jgi:outer membrane protein TolC
MLLNAVYKLFAVLGCWLLVIPGYGQDRTVEQYVNLALEQNPTLLAARLAESERRLGVDLATAGYRPTVDFRTDYFLAAGGRTIDFPVGDLFNPAYGALNQLTDSEQFPTDLENVNELLNPSNFYDARFEARLPLLQPRIKREVALREQQVRESEAATEVLRNDLRRQVRDLYYSHLLALEGERIIDSSRLVLEEVLRVNRVLVANEKITADAIYRTEAEIAQLDGRTANFRKQQEVSAAALNRLLGRDLATPIETSEPEEVRPLASDEDLRRRAVDQRPELRQLEAGIRSLQLLDQLQEAGGKPTLGLFVNAGAQGFLDEDAELGQQPYVFAGVGLAWSVYDGEKRSLTRQQTQLRAEQLRRQREDAAAGIEVQVYRAQRELIAEKAQLTAARAGAEAARATYAIVEAKYRNQRALLVELLDARNEVTTQELNENLSRFRLLQARAALWAALGE